MVQRSPARPHEQRSPSGRSPSADGHSPICLAMITFMISLVPA